MHPLLERYARLLVGYCTQVVPGDRVMLSVETPATEMARALVREVLRAGGEPFLRLTYPEYSADLVALAGDGLLASAPTAALEEMRAMDAFIRVSAPANTRSLQGADKQRLMRLQGRQKPVQEQRVNHTRWVGTLFPTAAGAQAAGMDLDAYERFVFDAMYLYEEEPERHWDALRSFQDRLIERLTRAREVRLQGPGTDLRLRVEGRTWVNSDGRRNMPSGEVFTGPHEASASGTITFDVPSNVQGVLVEGVRLVFERGRVVEATAQRGQDMLDAQLASDEGARFLGELGIGTNDRIRVATQSTLFDEKIGGTVHLALGRSYPQTGGTNDSAIHWDLVCDLRAGGRITLDGEPFQLDGRFLV